MPIARIPVNLTWTGATGSPGVNVWHARFDNGDPLSGDLSDVTDIIGQFYDAIEGLFPSTYTITYDGEAQGVGADEGTTYQSTPWTFQGEGAPAFLPPATAMFVNWRAFTGGRRGKGRTYLGPLTDLVTEGNGTPEEAYRAQVQAAANALVSASLGDLNGAVVIYSRTDGIARDVATADVPNMFAVLRSRRD